MAGFVKLDCGIVDSTIWAEPDDVLRTWIALLAKCDSSGVVRTAIPPLANLCKTTTQRMVEIIQILKSPDPYSRTSAHEGRRIEQIEGGFRLLNYILYRESDRTESGNTKEAYVYFLRAGDRIKIGWSRNPWARMSDLQTGSAQKLEMLHTQKGTKEDERALHKQFVQHNIRVGRAVEWFHAHPDILEYVALHSSTESLPVATRSSTKADAEEEADKSKSYLSSSSEADDPPKGTESGHLKLTPPTDISGKRAQRVHQITLDAITAFNAKLGKPNGLLPSVSLRVGLKKRQKQVTRILEVAGEICEEQYGSKRITPEFWKAYFVEVDRDPFKSGRQEPGRDHKNWKPTFEYLTRDGTMLEVFERAQSADDAA